MKNTDFECMCLIENKLGQDVWTYHCVRRDRRVGLTVYYSPEARQMSIPILHKASRAPDSADRCALLQAPCEAYSILGPERERLQTQHPGRIEPGLEFWRIMMKTIEAQGIPWYA